MSASFPKVKVYVALAFGMLAFGFGPNIVKYGVEYSAYKLAVTRTVFAFILLIPMWMVSQQDKKKHGEASSPLTQLEIIAGLALGLHFVTWIASLYYTSVASASVLVTTHPIILIIAERSIFRVRFPLLSWIGVTIAFTGSALLGYLDQDAGATYSNPILGNALAFIAALIFSVYFLISKKVRQNSSWIDYVFKIYGFAALACILVLLIMDSDLSDLFEPKLLLIGLALALGPQLLGHGSINYAVKFINPTIIATLILVEPLVASVIAVFMFEEIPAIESIFAMAIVFTGIGLTWAKREQD